MTPLLSFSIDGFNGFESGGKKTYESSERERERETVSV